MFPELSAEEIKYVVNSINQFYKKIDYLSMASESLKVSIIIPMRNEEDFIGKCLEGFVNQTYPKEKLK